MIDSTEKIDEVRIRNQPCEGYIYAIVVVVVTHVCPVPIEVIIVIIIIIYDTQKVKITVTADSSKNRKLKSAKQTINGGEQQKVLDKRIYSIIQQTKCSIDVRGGNTHMCEFTTDAGVISLQFLIKDDLLNVEPGHKITLPTILTLGNQIDQSIPSIQWFHKKEKFVNPGLYFNTIVTWATYGVYKIEMKLNDLGIMIRIENMRVTARNWTGTVIIVVVNVSLVVIGGVVVEYNRSTDGFCVSGTIVIIIFVVPIFVYCIPVVCFIYVFFIKRPGNNL
ncbi:uncharacterized protein LOC134722388 [Mytilus trossulus]|uniref:uncharacterized protein LOC134722388 n=1 Tax=Mytilus trossulus TaxID=6551 RepID=UPI003003F485